MRVTLIHNPGAGGGQPSGEALQQIIRSAGHEVRYQSCEEGDWTRAIEAPADLVAVAGGDGTLGRVAKLMIGRAIPVAALPLGTANNISRSLGAKDVSLEQQIASWDDSRRLRFDTGSATGPWGRKRFIEGMGVGLFAWTLPRAESSTTLQTLANTDDKLVYALQMLKDRLRHCPVTRIQATLDGQDISGEYVLLEAMNIPFVGPNLFLAPHGDPSDGCLDVALVNAAEREELQGCLSGWQRGTLCRPNLTTHRGRHLQIEWTGFHVHFDDELWPQEGDAVPREGATIEVRLGAESVEFLEPGLPVGA
jgi:diacylglycerol kinase family enzyme